MSLERRLPVELLAESPFQPATSWWRPVELAVVIRHGLPPDAAWIWAAAMAS